MNKKIQLKPLATALGTTFAVSLAIAPAVDASENPFAAVEYSSGYMLAAEQAAEPAAGKPADSADATAKGEEGKCGEANKEAANKGDEGACGAGMDGTAKGGEGKCG